MREREREREGERERGAEQTGQVAEEDSLEGMLMQRVHRSACVT